MNSPKTPKWDPLGFDPQPNEKNPKDKNWNPFQKKLHPKESTYPKMGSPNGFEWPSETPRPGALSQQSPAAPLQHLLWAMHQQETNPPDRKSLDADAFCSPAKSPAKRVKKKNSVLIRKTH